MDFSYSRDALDLRDGAREYFRGSCTPEVLRALLEDDSADLGSWSQLVDMGLVGFLVPESAGGLDNSDSGFVLLAEEAGYVALPEPLADVAGVAVSVLSAAEHDAATEILSEIATGETRVLVSHWINPYVNQLSADDKILHVTTDEVHLLEAGNYSVESVESIDPLRRLSKVNAKTSASTRIASGEKARRLSSICLQRGALFCAAELLGLTAAMIDMSRAYVNERKQFGVAIGTFQAVKHHLASAFAKLEFARPTVYRAAATADAAEERVDVHIAHAKIAATDAAINAAEAAIQVHGGIGYTFEADLHLWMKRVWALAGIWGDRNYHMNVVDRAVFDEELDLGPAATFG